MPAKLIVPVLLATAFCLAGCGHSHLNDHGGSTVNGGGGTPGGIAVPFLAANTTSPATFSGASAPATFTTGGGLVAGFAVPNPADSASAATVKLTTDSSGNLNTIEVTAQAGGFLFDRTFNTSSSSPFTSAITLNQLTFAVQQFLNAGAGAQNYLYQGTETGLSASSYGAWLQTNAAGGFTFGPTAFGLETTAGQMLALSGSGVATYNGATFGLGATNGTPFAFTGTAQVIANFSTQAVSASFSGITTANLSGVGSAIVLPTIAGAGTIGAGVNSNQYAFSLTGGAFTGGVTGTFYGTTAQETVGVWQATNGTGTSLVGSYGAHK